jgi:hypothetical protein
LRPRPTRPRSWCSCASPKRSAFSTIISVAFATSTPTSTTVVDTSTCVSPPRSAPSRPGAPRSRAARAEIDARVRQRRGDPLRRLARRAQVALLRLLDQRVDDVGLLAARDRLLQQAQHLAPLARAREQRAHRQPPGGQLVEHGQIEIAVQRHRERARDRRRGHHEHVRLRAVVARAAQRRALAHAEAVLLVHHDEARGCGTPPCPGAARACPTATSISPAASSLRIRSAWPGAADAGEQLDAQAAAADEPGAACGSAAPRAARSARAARSGVRTPRPPTAAR